MALLQRSIWRNPPLSIPGEYSINLYVSVISILLFILTYKVTKTMPLGWVVFAIPFIFNFIISSKSKEEDFELAYKRLVEGSRKNRIIRMGIVFFISWIAPILLLIWLISLGKMVLISL